MESVGYAKVLGEEFWKRRGEKMAEGAKQQAFAMSEAERMKRRDLSVIGELVRRLEAKMLPVPGTNVLMSRTEFTVGEWELYLRAEGHDAWSRPKDIEWADDYPVVNVRWEEVVTFCKWLSLVSGKEWRLPSNKEWETAAGETLYFWGDYFPPKATDGNFSILPDGTIDPERVGMDGKKGPVAVGSFSANALGFHDLGGNVWEWVSDMWGENGLLTNHKHWKYVSCGGSWRDGKAGAIIKRAKGNDKDGEYNRHNNTGFRLCCVSSS
jgi:formylglycine-generating enzyme required for sulfatase activity